MRQLEGIRTEEEHLVMYEMVNVGSNNKTLSLAGNAIVNSDNATWLQIGRLSKVGLNAVGTRSEQGDDEHRWSHQSRKT